MLSKFVLLSLFATSVVQAFPTSSAHGIHESRDVDHPQWLKKNRVPPDAILPVRIALSQTNLDNGHKELMSVSDPASPSYGKHWTAQEVIDFFKPTESSINAVRQWLEISGISQSAFPTTHGWIAFKARADEVESLLHAEYYEYEHVYTGAVVLSCENYSVPKPVQEHIDYITPGIGMLAPPQLLKKAPNEELGISRREITIETDDTVPKCRFLTPDCISLLYNIPPSNLAPDPRNKLGIYEAEQQEWNQASLDLFFHKCTSGRVPNGTAPVKYAIDGGDAEVNDQAKILGQELLLDLDIAYPIVYPQNIGIWSENDWNYQTANQTYKWGFNQLLDSIDQSYCSYSAYGETGDLPGIDPTYPDPEPSSRGGYNHSLQCGVYKPPTVLSVSYSGNEVDVPIAYQLRQCNEFLKLGLQGTTFLFAGSDAGVAGGTPNGPNECIRANGNTNVFSPSWPNTCPYVTAVGSTSLIPGHLVTEAQPEEVLNKDPSDPFSSGGGFSNIYPIPDYQVAAVEQYFENYDPPYPYYSNLATIAPNSAKINVSSLQDGTQGLYNRKGRGIPDISANGWNGLFAANGKVTPGGGNSQATPLLASIINRINEERLAVGKSPGDYPCSSSVTLF